MPNFRSNLNFTYFKRTCHSEEAVSDILRFVEEGEESDNDLIELYASDKDFERDISNIDENLSGYSDHNESLDEESIPTNLVSNKHRRKTAAYQIKLNSIDASRDETNYDPFILLAKAKEVIGQIPAATSSRKNNKESIALINQPNNTTGCNKSSDVIKNKPGISTEVKLAKSPIETFICHRKYVTG